MKDKPQRVGGLRVDPGVTEFQEKAATNVAALSARQRRDRQRVRVKYDLSATLKQRIEQAATGEHTSASQMAAFLLWWAVGQYEDRESPNGQALAELLGQARTPARAVRFAWDLEFGE
jgi:hypothetical protein